MVLVEYINNTAYHCNSNLKIENYFLNILHLKVKTNLPMLIDAGQFKCNSSRVLAKTAGQKIRTSNALDIMVALKER